MIAVALFLILLAVVLVLRGWDVRLVLFTTALILGSLVGQAPVILREFFNTFSNEKFLIPIGSAMGFAYVLKHTGCDVHMVRFLVSPLQRVRGLLLPGVVLCGFLVNIPVISQASAAVCLGTVVVPLLRAAGYSSVTIGSALLLGVSIGGELLNPGAPELNTVANQVGCSPREVVPAIVPILLPTLGVALTVFWWWSCRLDRDPLSTREPTTAAPHAPVPAAGQNPSEAEPLRLRKALVPLVPLAFLFLSGPPFQCFSVAPEWLVPPGGPSPFYSSRLIGLAMLVGMVAAAIASPSHAGGCMKAFFEGAGYGLTNIVSLIVTANCFGKAIEVVRLTDPLATWLQQDLTALHLGSGLFPLGFAWICGSGMATTQSLYRLFYEPALSLGANPIEVGVMVSVAAAAGRTMSPVAAVVLMCASLSGATPARLVLRVAPPLLLGVAVVLGLRLTGLI